jgi:carbonic anhydrase/acetyltransferase-like protein (isoleucine patch superfamily)
MNSTIMPNVIIGPNSVVGACSVVTKDVLAETVVAGNPAKFICSIEEYKKKVLAVWKDQKPVNYLNQLTKERKYSPKEINQMKEQELDVLYAHLDRLFSSFE